MLSTTTLTRREWHKLLAAGVLGASASGWMKTLAAQAAAQNPAGKRQKSCILLWMDGGPCHVDTFDPKPDASANIRGEISAIGTSVDGIQISDKFPLLAKQMGHMAILRGMTTEEGDHGRARSYLHTGYRPGVGGVDYPTLGSIVSAELPRPHSPLPNFVVTGSPLVEYIPASPGYRGALYQPLIMKDAGRGLENMKPLVANDEYKDRVDVLDQLEQGFSRTHKNGSAQAHAASVNRAVQLVRSSESKAFDISLEPQAVRDAYGDSEIGRNCLMARRLVEAGVAFVEIYSSNWDYHVKESYDKAKTLMTQMDHGASSLLTDLKDRGLLQDTLVIMMGEFGRTPTINRNGGRDHHNKAWCSVLAGGGIKGGQVVGKTDPEGRTVVERPISAIDFMATVCKVMGIDYTRQIDTPAGRPVGVVDKGAKPIGELFAG
jgi:uncharacterized protein (DUF1501 family)